MLRKRGRRDLVGAETIVQVFAKSALSNVGRKVAVGGRDQLTLKPAAGGIAHRMKRPRLDHAEQLDLNGEVHVPQFVQKDGSQLGTSFEPSLAVAHRSGERTAAVAEEFRFDQSGRQRRDVDGEERGGIVVGKRHAAVVEREIARLGDGPRHEFLGGSGRAGYEGGEFAHALE